MVTEGDTRTVVGGHVVRGVRVDSETRCAHYDAPRDVIAIRFRCCGTYYPCHRCHEVLADHGAEQWPRGAFDTPAVLCGACGREHAVREYLDGDDACPACGAGFNPGCREHHHLYFETEPSVDSG